MSRKTSADFPAETLKLFDLYVHGDISRRDFLRRVSQYTVAGVTALSVLQALTPNFAYGEQIKADDPRLVATEVEFSSPAGYGKAAGYLVQSSQHTGPKPLVLVVHENRGLNPHIRDVTRRLALQGFIAFAPDALFPLGGYPGDEDTARQKFSELAQQKTRQDFLAAASFLQQLPGGNGKVGVIGFCYGGAIANFLAVHWPALAAAVPFYGRQADLVDVPQIKAPLLIHYASNDERVNSGAAAYDAALKAAGKSVQSYTYANTEHGFHNDTTPRYDEAAATLAWQRSVAFLRQHLQS